MRNRIWIFWVILCALIGYTFTLVELLVLPLNIPSGAAGAITLGCFFFMIGWRWIPSLTPLGTFMMGGWASFLFFSLVYGAVSSIWDLISRFWPAAGHLADPLFLDPWRSHIILLGISLVFSLLGFIQVKLGPKVKEVLIPLPTSEQADNLDALHIVQISDLHISPLLKTPYVQKVVDRVLSLKPDMIALTGDLVDGRVSELGHHAEPLKHLRAPLGSYYVTGNHEYYWNAAEWINRIRELGIEVLTNENRTAEHRGARVLIAGVPDTSATSFIADHICDPEKAAQVSAIEVGQEHHLKILLSHRPDPFEQAEKAGFHLQLSGHTHAGQFFPFSLIIGFFHRYSRGLNQHRKMWFYINAGTGFWGPPHRFGVPAEITSIRFRKALTDEFNDNLIVN